MFSAITASCNTAQLSTLCHSTNCSLPILIPPPTQLVLSPTLWDFGFWWHFQWPYEVQACVAKAKTNNTFSALIVNYIAAMATSINRHPNATCSHHSLSLWTMWCPKHGSSKVSRNLWREMPLATFSAAWWWTIHQGLMQSRSPLMTISWPIASHTTLTITTHCHSFSLSHKNSCSCGTKVAPAQVQS